MTREIVASFAMTLPKRGAVPRANLAQSPRTLAPLLDAAEMLGIAGADIRLPYDAREIIARIVDQVNTTYFARQGERFLIFVFLCSLDLVSSKSVMAQRWSVCLHAFMASMLAY